MIEIFIFFSIFLFVPTALSRLILHANWTEICQAYGIFIAVNIIIGMSLFVSGVRGIEAISWPVITSMFCIIFSIPLIILASRVLGRTRASATPRS